MNNFHLIFEHRKKNETKTDEITDAEHNGANELDQTPTTSSQCHTQPVGCSNTNSDRLPISTESASNDMEKIDIIGRINGDFGKWQLRTVLLIFLCKIPSAWFMACIIFTAPAPRNGEVFCHPPETIVNTSTIDKFQRILRHNKESWLRMTHPEMIDENTNEPITDFCNVYVNAHRMAERYFHSISTIRNAKHLDLPNNETETVPCDRFFHHSDYVSIVTDYDLVCDKNILVATTQFFHLFGVLTGGLLATYLLKQ